MMSYFTHKSFLFWVGLEVLFVGFGILILRDGRTAGQLRPPSEAGKEAAGAAGEGEGGAVSGAAEGTEVEPGAGSETTAEEALPPSGPLGGVYRYCRAHQSMYAFFFAAIGGALSPPWNPKSTFWVLYELICANLKFRGSAVVP